MSNVWLSLPIAVLAACGCLAQAPAADRRDAPRQFEWRGVWEWSMAKGTEADLTRIADTAQGLGFNALLMSPPRNLLSFMRERCHERGIRLYLSTVFAGGEESWQQVLRPEEHERLKRPFGDTYQQGGEPLTADELYYSLLPCWNRPEVRDHFRRLVVESAGLPVDGLALDAVGYTNFYRCFCPTCEGRLAQFRGEHPALPRREAEEACAEQALVDFINAMAWAAREARPDIGLTIHVYPYFRPHPYYGNRLDVDYVGQTVAWFFRPHWPMTKVARLAKETVEAQAAYLPRSVSAPFIGFYRRPLKDRRSAARVTAEIEAIRSAGAGAIQFAELGSIAEDTTVAGAVARALGGPGLADRR